MGDTSDDIKDGAENEEEEEYIDPVILKPDLYAAAVANDEEEVKALLQQNVPGTFIDTANGWTPLHWAAMHGNVTMLKSLLAGGASEPYHRLVERARRVRQAKEISGDEAPKINRIEDEDGGLDEVKFDNTEEEENEDEEDAAKAAEVSVDLLKNTPLLWATHKGKLRIIWHLLVDGYSPNDTDKMDNNALHLAAAVGDLKILKVLIEDGGKANVVNHYKNHPVDMSKNKSVAAVVAVAMEQGASMTEKDVAEKHEKNINAYHNIVDMLTDAVLQAARVDSPMDMTMSESTTLASNLSSAITNGKEWSLDEDLIVEGERLLLKLELSQELQSDILAVQKIIPISSQKVYIDNVTKLERSIEQAKGAGIDQAQLDIGLDLITRCQIEYWLALLLERLKDVVTADDSNEHDMNKLKAAIAKAQELRADKDLVARGTKFLGRLGAELGMSRAIKCIPHYKLPPPATAEVPEGYWGEKDQGKVKETEEYPLPPEGGEYVWLSSDSFSALGRAIQQIKSSYEGAEELSANPVIIAEAKEKLHKSEKDYKVLQAKDEDDKTRAVEVVKKLAKKLKGGKKAKPKK
ncbi:hypothetical protein B484DRAFT_453947 [Ochromonadaceae sp. CCMP2298]|nr:hypothetical protein B484DRAFT_453947 [Ochromonadaceae sp. CCMP2298]|mmetsp:Transcript_14559/g.32104  ORF Transcript_14559/g.32104 Transcript_14559/m.32104 type:complete len:578 (-) Transcript_14559:71-1804(-)